MSQNKVSNQNWRTSASSPKENTILRLYHLCDINLTASLIVAKSLVQPYRHIGKKIVKMRHVHMAYTRYYKIVNKTDSSGNDAIKSERAQPLHRMQTQYCNACCIGVQFKAGNTELVE